MIVELTDLEDPRLDDYIRLTDVALRRRLETERGLYMAESTNVIMRAVQAGHRPRSFLTAPQWLDQLRPWIELSCGSTDGGDIPVFVAAEETLSQVTGFHLHRGSMAAMNRPQLADPLTLLEEARGGEGAKRIVILENLVDHTNVGAAFRSCAALGADAVLVTPQCADPLYRRSVRVSMGTVFQVPWTRIEPWPRALDALSAHGWIAAALALSDDSVTLDAFATEVAKDPTARVAVILGTEGDGLQIKTIAAADRTVRIPMAGGVDSLNVAAAGAVALWALRLP